MNRVYNFSAGPSMLPVPVLERAAAEMLSYGESGMSVAEMSHRSKDFEPWLTRLCINIYRDKLRRLSRNPFLNFSSNEAKDAVFATVPAPERKDYTDLYAAIDRLPKKLRLAIILFYFEDMDISKTAETLRIPPGTVKSRLNKARKLLKEVLTDETDIRL